MRIAAQADAFIEKYGNSDGLARMKKIGYRTVTYAITERYDTPFTTEWTDEQIREKYEAVRAETNKAGLEIVHVYESNEIYNALLEHTTEARKTMVLNSMKAAAYMGAKVFFIKPATFNKNVELDVKTVSKTITVDFIKLLKPYAKELGIQLGLINNFRRSSNVPFGCNANELLELCEEFDLVCALDVANAYNAWCRVEDMLETLKGKVVALLVNDLENMPFKNPTIPMFGSGRYPEILQGVKGLGDDVYAVTVSAPIYKRYRDFADVPGVFDAVDELLYTATKVVADRANQA